MKATTIGIDLAKSCSSFTRCDDHGKWLFNKHFNALSHSCIFRLIMNGPSVMPRRQKGATFLLPSHVCPLH